MGPALPLLERDPLAVLIDAAPGADAVHDIDLVPQLLEARRIDHRMIGVADRRIGELSGTDDQHVRAGISGGPPGNRGPIATRSGRFDSIEFNIS